LLVTSALFLRSFAAQSRVDPGFGAAPTGVIWMAMPGDRYGADRQPAGLREIERRVRAIPNVEHVGIVNNIMLNPLNESDRPVNVDGFQPPKGEQGFATEYSIADSGFFNAAGIQVVSGRSFDSGDLPATPRVAMINEAMARKFWASGNAVGRTFRIDTTVYRIVGITKQTKVRSLGEAPQPFFFLSFAQSPSPDFYLLAESRPGTDAAQTTTRMMAALREIDPGFMIIQAKTMQQHLAAMVLPAQLGAVAFALFAGLALVLAMIGIYGVVRYAVARRSREVAIRLAVGASPAGVVRLLMREGLSLVVVGAVIGIVLGLLASRALQSLLYGVGALDPMAFIVTPAILVGVGALAAFLPARRASHVDPANALRAE
jgi:putative ABC transport system permease protein